VGVALAVLYLAFLGVWYWATRVRPRAIDTNRRML
jgi:cbb3-type cytochrome oxidase subunit 3